MTQFQKGIACGILLVGLQFAAGCLLQGQSRAIAGSQSQTPDATMAANNAGLRDRIRERVNERVNSELADPSTSAQSSDGTATPSNQAAPKVMTTVQPAQKTAQRAPAAGANRSQLVSLIADEMVARISQSSCTDFRSSLQRAQSQQNGQNDAMRARAMQMLQANPDLRRTFIDAVAAPLANKMFDCGMIPPQ